MKFNVWGMNPEPEPYAICDSRESAQLSLLRLYLYWLNSLEPSNNLKAGEIKYDIQTLLDDGIVTDLGFITEQRKENEMYRYRINLDTQSDIVKFVGLVTNCTNTCVELTDGTGHLRVSGKSLLGAMYTMEFDDIICESDRDICFLIKDFIKE